MRFLLLSHSGGVFKSSITKQKEPNKLIKKITPSSSQDLKAWGQQCSPQCGCVIRFETTIDHSSQKILSSSVHTISILKDSNNKPVMTSRNRPMFQNCNCNTLNQLGKQVAEYLPNKKLQDIRNMTEFEGVRSSMAFRHAVLRTLDLSEKKKQIKETSLKKIDSSAVPRENCYDVMEEAFLAMVRGHMPAPRQEENPNSSMFSSLVIHNRNSTVESDSSLESQSPSLSFDDEVFGKFLSSDWRKDFNFYEGDCNETSSVLDSEQAHDNPPQESMDDMMDFDWLSYVDSQEQNKDEFA